jgi:hypothetical protein
MIEVRELEREEQYERYAAFGDEVYAGNASWRPPDKHHLAHEISGRVAQGEYARFQPFWAEQEGKVRAVVTAVADGNYRAHWREPLGHLISFEALPDSGEAAEAVLRRASAWLGEQGCRAVRFHFLPGLQLPLLLDAYDEPPTIFHGYNPAYYHSYVKNAGFTTERGVMEYQVRFSPELAAAYREMAEVPGVTFRPFDFSRLEPETELFARLCNETFSSHWGYSPLSVAAFAGLTVGLRDSLEPEFCVFAEAEGEPAGFVYSLPDLNRQPCDHGVLLIIGVRSAFRRRGVNLALGARSYLAMMAKGYQSASYTVVLDDNWPSRRTAEKLGARVARNFNVYRKELG